MLGFIGTKIGMTQVFKNDGSVCAVTVVRTDPNVVIHVKTKEKSGYSAVLLGCGVQKKERVSKPLLGQFKKAGVEPCFHLKEFRTERASDYQAGMVMTASHYLKTGDRVDVQGVSKGKGFQGVMKRHHFAGGSDSHGNSLSHRTPGSIGQNTYPGRVIPGKRLPGHMGDQAVTIKNLEVVQVEVEQNIVLIKGALPGSQNAAIYLYPHGQEFEQRVVVQGGGEKEGQAKKENAAKSEDKSKTKAA